MSRQESALQSDLKFRDRQFVIDQDTSFIGHRDFIKMCGINFAPGQCRGRIGLEACVIRKGCVKFPRTGRRSGLDVLDSARRVGLIDSVICDRDIGMRSLRSGIWDFKFEISNFNERRTERGNV
jgi:hypothetical protein